jgi:hypothetical protein
MKITNVVWEGDLKPDPKSGLLHALEILWMRRTLQPHTIGS